MEKMFMNPKTGSVAPWSEWAHDQAQLNLPKEDLETLIEVVEDKNGEWVERDVEAEKERELALKASKSLDDAIYALTKLNKLPPKPTWEETQVGGQGYSLDEIIDTLSYLSSSIKSDYC